MSVTDLPLELRITAVFDVDQPKRHVVVEILDATDAPAEAMTAEWEAKEFTLDDLFGSLRPHAVVTVTENGGAPEHYTGETFDGGAVLRELDGVDPTEVTFADFCRPADASAYGARPAGPLSDERAEQLAGYVEQISQAYPGGVGLAVAGWLGYAPSLSDLGVAIKSYVDEQVQDSAVTPRILVVRVAQRFPELGLRP